uniref:tripartite tricarboxylate transporter TctB family protein n=1 Tax=Pararhizobium sp. IMCC3301 TaxID=3067904 RepID=UPI002740A675|nr:tripartite tricarboxylate transporter TctB family protein [Pararhizobium sp. IMCC3301]
MQRSNVSAWMSLSRLTAIGLFIIGASVAFSALSYEIGTLRRMGPGYFPMLLGIALCLISGMMLFERPATDKQDDATPRASVGRHLRALLFPLAGILAFAGLIKFAGFAPAVFVGAVLAGLAEPKNRLFELCLIALLITGFATLVFVYALGIPVRLVAF